MVVWTLAIGQQEQLLWTQLGGLTSIQGKGPTHLNSGTQLLSNKEAARYSTCAAALEMHMGHRAPTSICSGADDEHPRRSAGYESVVTPETVITLCQQGQPREAVEALGLLVHRDYHVFESLFYKVLKECVAKKDLPLGRRVHALTVKKGYETTDTFLCNHLLRMYASHARLEEAMAVFTMVAKPDAFTWSAIISAHVKHGQDKQAIQLYSRMHRSSVKADGHVFVAALQACARAGDLECGQEVHADVLASGAELNVFVWNGLVDMYAKCGSLGDAQRVFDGLGHKDVVTWNAMIAGYSQQGRAQDALRLYRAMQDEGTVQPNIVTFVCLLQACASVAALQVGRQLHAQIKEQRLQKKFLVAGGLINMYGKCGSMADAQQVFEALPERDVVTWSALIAGHTRQGDSEEVFALFARMRKDGIQPDGITFLNLLAVCSHTGLVTKGREYFEAMSRQYGITPTTDHYTCMVDLLGRAGQVDEALAFVRTMPVQPDAALWRTLLGACRKWGNVDVGRHAFNEVLKLDKKDAAAYVLMSNIYTSAQMWEHAQEVQGRRANIRACKQPGQSWWTDIEGLVHSFLVWDKKHPETETGVISKTM